MAKVKISNEDYNRLWKVIADLPEMFSGKEQRLLLSQRVELVPILTDLDYSGNPKNFSQHLVTTLQGRGILRETSQPALFSLFRILLEHPNVQGDPDDLAFIERLLEIDGGSGGNHRVLFLASNPLGMDALGLDREARAIQDRIKEAPGSNKIEFQPMQAARYDDLVNEMLTFKPSIVHFAGHGGEDGQIIFQNEAGYSEGASPAQVSHLFKTLRQESNALRAVVLNACYLDVLAQVLVEEAGVPYALGMYYAVPDDVAIAFATGFYRGIAASARIDTAFELGRNSLMGDYDDYKDYPSMRQSSQ